MSSAPPAPTVDASADPGTRPCNTVLPPSNSSDIELPEIPSDSDGDPAEFPAWTREDLTPKLRLQQYGGNELVQNLFGTVGLVDEYGRGSPSERFTHSTSPDSSARGTPNRRVAPDSPDERPQLRQRHNPKRSGLIPTQTVKSPAKPAKPPRPLPPSRARNVKLANTGFAAKPVRRHEQPRKSQPNEPIPSKALAVIPEVQDQIRSKYRLWCPAIDPFLAFGPAAVPIVEYKPFSPYRITPKRGAIPTQGRLETVEKEAKEIMHLLPSSVDDSQLDKSFAQDFMLGNLVSHPGQSILDVTRQLSREKERSEDIGNVYHFLLYSVVWIHLSMASTEEVCLTS